MLGPAFQCVPNLIPSWLTAAAESPEGDVPEVEAEASVRPLPTAQTVWQHGINRLVSDEDFPADLITTLRHAEVRWGEPVEEASGVEAELEEVDVEPCERCGSWEMWQDMNDTWHCCNCDPSRVTARMRDIGTRLRNWYSRMETEYETCETEYDHADVRGEAGHAGASGDRNELGGGGQAP